jgi:branched-chain amino acid aminotransferase
MVGSKKVPAGRPALRIDDRGFTHGDGAFETLRARDGAPVALSRHLARLAATLRHLDIASDPWLDDVPRRVRTLLKANGLSAGEARVRLRVSRGTGRGLPTVVLTAERLPADVRRRRRGVRAAIVPATPGALAAHKTLCYLPWIVAMRASPGAEPLAVDDGGHVLEGATTNVFAVVDGTISTPPADGRLLPGVARAVLLEAAARAEMPVREAPLTLDALLAAEEAFVSNALLRAAPLLGVGDRPLPAGPGPVLRSLLARFDEVAGA